VPRLSATNRSGMRRGAVRCGAAVRIYLGARVNSDSHFRRVPSGARHCAASARLIVLIGRTTLAAHATPVRELRPDEPGLGVSGGS
jgi:hypothetical protein